MARPSRSLNTWRDTEERYKFFGNRLVTRLLSTKWTRQLIVRHGLEDKDTNTATPLHKAASHGLVTETCRLRKRRWWKHCSTEQDFHQGSDISSMDLDRDTALHLGVCVPFVCSGIPLHTKGTQTPRAQWVLRGSFGGSGGAPGGSLGFSRGFLGWS